MRMSTVVASSSSSNHNGNGYKNWIRKCAAVEHRCILRIQCSCISRKSLIRKINSFGDGDKTQNLFLEKLKHTGDESARCKGKRRFSMFPFLHIFCIRFVNNNKLITDFSHLHAISRSMCMHLNRIRAPKLMNQNNLYFFSFHFVAS